MSTLATTGKAQCVQCGKERSAVRCEGCFQTFCYNHFTNHRQELSKQLDDIELTRDLLRDTLNLQATDQKKHPLIKQIDDWKVDSIEKIEKTAEECKSSLFHHINENINQVEANLSKLTDTLKHIRQEDDYNEADLSQLSGKLKQLAILLESPGLISIERNSASLVNKITIVASSSSGKHVYHSKSIE